MAIKFNTTRTHEGFSLIELMLVVTIIGIMAATAMPMFTNYAARAKTSEALMSISKMSNGEVEYFSKNNAFIDAGPTNIPPSMDRVAGNFAADTRWQALSFGVDGAIQYGYQAVVTSPNAVDCEALGDLDGDGITSTFRRTVSLQDSGAPGLGGILIFDELE